MDFNLNDEQELFVAGIRELMASEKTGRPILPSATVTASTRNVLSKHWRIWVSTVC